MNTTMSSKGQIVIPAALRRKDHLLPGHRFVVERIGRGEYRLVLQESPDGAGRVDWLLACPDKGYLVPVESESTDSLLPGGEAAPGSK